MYTNFYTVEGLDFTGKTTVCQRLKENFKDLNKKLIITREPGGTKFGSSIRKLIMDKTYHLDAKTEALLFEVDRSYHVENIIKPYLNKGYIVVSDRYLDSSTTYQAYVRGIPLEDIEQLHKFTVKDVYPFKTFYIDIPVEVLIKRRNKIISESSRQLNRLDEKSTQTYEEVRKGFLLLCERYNKRFIKIDGTKSIDEITQIIQSIILANS